MNFNKLPASILVTAGWMAAANLISCGRSKPPVLEGDDVVLARVADLPVTRYEVDQALTSTLGTDIAGSANEQLRKTMLESLVETRALAKVAESELTPLEKAAVDKQVGSYREQLLVKKYLAKHAPPGAVTDGMVEDYYKSHPDRFGGKTTRSYEMIGTERTLTPAERDSLLAKLKEADKQKDWKEWTQSLKSAGFPVVFRDGDVGEAEKVVHPKLVELMTASKPEQASSVVFVQGRAYVVRVTGEQRTPPRPLEEVRGEIRAMLAPTQVKDAVKKAASDVLKRVSVAYP